MERQHTNIVRKYIVLFRQKDCKEAIATSFKANKITKPPRKSVYIFYNANAIKD
jgi:hypothetical protein